MNNIEDARLVTLPRHAGAGAEIVVAETAAQVPFQIARVFALAASAGAKRGRHAHRRCAQFMICVNGAVSVTCDDGAQLRTFKLDRRDVALLVPPGLWNMIDFQQSDCVLVVLCDRLYEEEDYIRDYAEFLAFREITCP